MNYTEFIAFVETIETIEPVSRLLSETIKFFDEIVELDFSNCNLKQLPEETPWCNNLRVLNCANNQLTFLEVGFDKYPNHVIAIPSIEDGIVAYQYVFMSDYYKNLTHLDCSNNQLTDLPESIKTVKH